MGLDEETLKALKEIRHPIISSVVSDRASDTGVSYHDDNDCSYSCHSDHGDNS